MKIESRPLNPLHFANRFKKHLRITIPGMLTILAMIHIFVQDEQTKSTVLYVYFLIASAFIVTLFYSVISSSGRDFSGQFIEIDGNRVRSKELFTQAAFFTTKEALFSTCDIDLTEVQAIENAENDYDSNRVIGIILCMKEGYQHSKLEISNSNDDLPPQQNHSSSSVQTNPQASPPMRFRLSSYGYDHDTFAAVIKEIVLAFERLKR